MTSPFIRRGLTERSVNTPESKSTPKKTPLRRYFGETSGAENVSTNSMVQSLRQERNVSELLMKSASLLSKALSPTPIEDSQEQQQVLKYSSKTPSRLRRHVLKKGSLLKKKNAALKQPRWNSPMSLQPRRVKGKPFTPSSSRVMITTKRRRYRKTPYTKKSNRFLKLPPITPAKVIAADNAKSRIIIQSVVRGWIVRKAYKAQQEKIRCAFVLQSAVRGWIVRKAYKAQQEKIRCAFVLQSVVRGWIIRKAYKAQQEKIRCAFVLQSAVRGWIAYKAYKAQQEKLKKLHQIMANTATSAALAATRASVTASDIVFHIIEEQKFQALWVNHFENEIRIYRAAAIIQRMVRARKNCCATAETVVRKTLLSQTLRKRRKRLSRRRRRKLILTAATVKVQKSVRVWIARKMLKSKQNRITNAAILIQTAIRAKKARQVYSLLKQSAAIKESAAIKIQALIRAYFTLRLVKEMRKPCLPKTPKAKRPNRRRRRQKRRRSAAIAIQRVARVWIARRDLNKMIACETLRKVFPVYIAKTIAMDEKAKTLVLIQNAFLVMECEKERIANEELQNKRRGIAALVIQQAIRASNARQALFVLKIIAAKKVSAAIVIQQVIRASIARQELFTLKIIAAKKVSATIVIQQAIRASIARQELFTLKVIAAKKVSAAIVIQTAVRGIIAYKKLLKLKIVAQRENILCQILLLRTQIIEYESSRKIQSFIRGYIVRCRLANEQNAALVIQRLGHFFRVRNAQRKSVLASIANAAVIVCEIKTKARIFAAQERRRAPQTPPPVHPRVLKNIKSWQTWSSKARCAVSQVSELKLKEHVQVKNVSTSVMNSPKTEADMLFGLLHDSTDKKNYQNKVLATNVQKTSIVAHKVTEVAQFTVVPIARQVIEVAKVVEIVQEEIAPQQSVSIENHKSNFEVTQEMNLKDNFEKVEKVLTSVPPEQKEVHNTVSRKQSKIITESESFESANAFTTFVHSFLNIAPFIYILACIMFMLNSFEKTWMKTNNNVRTSRRRRLSRRRRQKKQK